MSNTYKKGHSNNSLKDSIQLKNLVNISKKEAIEELQTTFGSIRSKLNTKLFNSSIYAIIQDNPCLVKCKYELRNKNDNNNIDSFYTAKHEWIKRKIIDAILDKFGNQIEMFDRIQTCLLLQLVYFLCTPACEELSSSHPYSWHLCSFRRNYLCFWHRRWLVLLYILLLHKLLQFQNLFQYLLMILIQNNVLNKKIPICLSLCMLDKQLSILLTPSIACSLTKIKRKFHLYCIMQFELIYSLL